MNGTSKMEYVKAIYHRYHKASKAVKNVKPRGRKRECLYNAHLIQILSTIWEAAGYPCSVRLKALLGRWMPWARKRFHLMPPLERQLLSISTRQIDRRLRSKNPTSENASTAAPSRGAS